jgi:hypothetical protein
MFRRAGAPGAQGRLTEAAIYQVEPLHLPL